MSIFKKLGSGRNHDDLDDTGIIDAVDTDSDPENAVSEEDPVTDDIPEDTDDER